MNITWQPHQKPPADVCPQKYCFFWGDEDSLVASGLYENLQEAVQNLQPVTKGQCGCEWGLCKRLDPLKSQRDLFEPHEPLLDYDGLPWFYFIPHPFQLSAEAREEYIAESENLWGKEHWLK